MEEMMEVNLLSFVNLIKEKRKKNKVQYKATICWIEKEHSLKIVETFEICSDNIGMKIGKMKNKRNT